jgi:hypothetical protein
MLKMTENHMYNNNAWSWLDSVKIITFNFWYIYYVGIS